MAEFLAQNIYLDYFLRIFASLVCGIALGFERKMRQHTVGIRTLTLMSISSAMLCILSDYMARSGLTTGDPTRIAAGIVTGVGFLGAGVIVNHGLNIRGLTSAAITFTASALGVTCGAGLYYPAFLVLVFSFFTLFLIAKIEKKFFPAEKRKFIEITVTNDKVNEALIKEVLTKAGIVVHDLDIDYNTNSGVLKLIYAVHSPDSLNTISLLEELSKTADISNIKLTKN